MSFFRSTNPFVVLSLSLLIVSGCNAFEFMYGGESDEPDVLLDDARIALQSGDADKAINLLEKALEKDPANPEIKIELSSALFQANDIDLLVMKELAAFISETPATPIAFQPGTSALAKSNRLACNFQGDVSLTTELDFTQDTAYQLLAQNTDILERAAELLRDILDDGSLDSLPANIMSNAHLMRAISSMATAVVEIHTYAQLAQVSLHFLPGTGIGYCAVDNETLMQFETFVMCEALPDIDQAADDLVSRQSLFSDIDSELVSAITSAREEITAEISASCQASQ